MKTYRTAAAAVLGMIAASLVSASGSAQTRTFTLTGDFDNGALTKLNNVQVKPETALPDGRVVLGPTAVSKTRLVWVSNTSPGGTSPGWIVRIDTTTGKQTARFDSALISINGQPTGAPATYNLPGRVAVDANGDVWIINRAYNGTTQGSLSKFSGDISHCIDRNNNGVIDTSRDANGDGIVDPLKKYGSVPDNEAEYYGQADECILTTIKIGTPGAIPRAVAVDKRGKIWVGTYNGSTVYRFNPNEPVALEAQRTFNTSSGWPVTENFYSAATGDDFVYFVGRQGDVVQININDSNIKNGSFVNARRAGCLTSGYAYGIVAVPGTQQVWVGGYSGSGLYKIDFAPATPTCTWKAMGGQITAMTLDLNGNIWASGYSSGNVFKLDQNMNVLATCASSGTRPHGLSVDFDGNIWSVQDATVHLVRFSPTNNANNCGRTGPYPIDRGPLGAGGFDYTPYLYSDFTGTQINRQAPYTRVGFWEGVYDGGAPGIAWSTVSWNTEIPNPIPAETSLKIGARAADTLAELATAPYEPCQNNAPLIGIKGRYVQLKADLAGPGYVTPAVSDLTVQGPCAVLGESCCVKDSDCSDGKPCTEDRCPVPGGSCIHPPVAECCTGDLDCNDSNPCTVDGCDLGSNTCQHLKQAGCCISNAECDDGLPCTADVCSTLGGTCTNVNINGCCVTHDDCTQGNPCSASTCPGPGQLCNIAFVPGCCKTDDDCKEVPDDLCTLNACDLSTNTCTLQVIPECCNEDKDCLDSDPCTTDQCSGPGGQCTFLPKTNCCTPSSPQVGTECDLPVSPFDKPPCKPGKLVCENNDFKCEGAVQPTDEVCNWSDDNCDGVVDNGACPQGGTCINGVCAKPCGSPEFPCEAGYACKGGVCLPISCDNVICPPGQTCVSGDCVGGDAGVGGSAGAAGAAGSAGAAGTAGAAGAAGKAGAAGSTADGGLPDSSAGSAGAAGSAAGAAGSAAAAGSTGASGAAGAEKFEENYGMPTGGGGCRCSTPGGSSSGRAAAWFVALLGLASTLRLGRRFR